MKIGETGAVNGGNDNVKWSKQLADKLDEADGKKDGKIDANIWNSFLGDNKSKGNKINRFINLNRAEVSFDYYLKKKDNDVEGLDWNNWKEMFNVFIDKYNKNANLKFADVEPSDSQPPAATPSESPTAGSTTVTDPQSPTSSAQTQDPSQQTPVQGQQTPVQGQQTPPTAEELNNKLDSFTLGKDNIPTPNELQQAGYTEQAAVNRAKVYKNDAGETVTISADGKSLVYQSNGTIIERSYDDNGKLTQNAIAVVTAPGVFSTGVVEVGSEGVPTLVLKKQHSLPATPLEFYKDGIEGHKENISELRNKLDIPNDISFDISDLKDADLPKDIISADGNYKVLVEITNDNVLRVTYYKKQEDDNYTDLGYFLLNKKDSQGTLRGYDFTFQGVKANGQSFSLPNANWNDFE